MIGFALILAAIIITGALLVALNDYAEGQQDRGTK